jgi:hypothetical protein
MKPRKDGPRMGQDSRKNIQVRLEQPLCSLRRNRKTTRSRNRKRESFRSMSGQPGKQHYAKVQNVHLRQMFAEDPQRAEHFAFDAVGLYFDYSKNRIGDETVRLLLELANQSACARGSTSCLAAGRSMSPRNAVLHVALRATKDESIFLPICDNRNAN